MYIWTQYKTRKHYSYLAYKAQELYIIFHRNPWRLLYKNKFERFTRIVIFVLLTYYMFIYTASSICILTKTKFKGKAIFLFKPDLIAYKKQYVESKKMV